MRMIALGLMMISGITYSMGDTKQMLRERYDRKGDLPIRAASENGGKKDCSSSKPKSKFTNTLHKPACSPSVEHKRSS